MARKILYGVYHWGLGHATRSLGLIRALIERGDAVTIVMAPGPGLRLLRSELGAACEYFPFRDTPAPFSRYPIVFYLRMTAAMPWVLAGYRREHRLAEKMVAERRYDLVVSDSRLGLWSVVRIPRAASSPPSPDSFFASRGVAARITSIGSGVPMIPVEQTRTCELAICSASPVAAAINCAFL